MFKSFEFPDKIYWHFQYSRTFWEEKDLMKNLISYSLVQKIQKKYLPSYRLCLI